jgi:hypothetical protein
MSPDWSVVPVSMFCLAVPLVGPVSPFDLNFTQLVKHYMFTWRDFPRDIVNIF